MPESPCALARAQPGLFVPKDAVVRRASGQVVFVVEDAKARMVPIKTGRTHEGLIEVVEGQLRPGDAVVVTGNEMLQDQMAVVSQTHPPQLRTALCTLIAFCVRYPVTVIVGMILALLFGVIALSRLPIQMTPTVERPEISVETTYLGAAPQEVENEIVDRQEEKLISVQELQELVSTSSEGRGMVTLRFDWGVNKDVARLEVSEKLDLVQDLPDDAERPIIRAVSSDEETPIAWIVITTTRDINEVRQEAEDAIKPRLERVEGVGAVWLFGGQEREVHVILDYQAMTRTRLDDSPGP